MLNFKNVEKFKIEEEIKMTNKTLLFTLAISGLIGMGETANAVTVADTFSCPTIDKLHYHVVSRGNVLEFSVSQPQRISPSLAIDWSQSGTFEGIHWDKPDKKELNIKSINIKNASLGYNKSPVCTYEVDLSGLTLKNGRTSFDLSLEPPERVIQNCTLSGTTFTDCELRSAS